MMEQEGVPMEVSIVRPALEPKDPLVVPARKVNKTTHNTRRRKQKKRRTLWRRPVTLYLLRRSVLNHGCRLCNPGCASRRSYINHASTLPYYSAITVGHHVSYIIDVNTEHTYIIVQKAVAQLCKRSQPENHARERKVNKREKSRAVNT